MDCKGSSILLMRLAVGIISFPTVTGLFISNIGFKASLFRLQASSSSRRHSYFGSPCGYRYNVARCQSNTQDMEKSDGKMNDEDDFDDSDARSQFGTKEYWQDMYNGLGDFDAEEYSWYYGFETLKPFFRDFLPSPKNSRLLVPGVGNDGTLLDLHEFGYSNITAYDYSSSAIDRQSELLSYSSQASADITLLVRDARNLDEAWTGTYDVIFEKGALDAIYLSGEGYVDLAVKEMKRCLKVGGYVMSVSGVLPEDHRRNIFPVRDWEWVRDGTDDLKAGCFILRRKR